MLGLKKKLKITACSVANGAVRPGSDSFEAMLNPSSYKHDFTINYNTEKTLGTSAPQTNFSDVGAEEVSFELMLDGTGAVSLLQSDVKDQVKVLSDLVYKYDGDNHEPSVVQLVWGSMIFTGRLKSMKVDYKLFKPSGEPLRATVDLTFLEYVSKKEEVKQANRSSPDLSHHITVKAGDTLPALCFQIYKDSSYYSEVARLNNITNFRDIAPGSVLNFPPLR